MLQNWPTHIKWECGPWHVILGWWPRTHWPGDPAGQPESRLISVFCFFVFMCGLQLQVKPHHPQQRATSLPLKCWSSTAHPPKLPGLGSRPPLSPPARPPSLLPAPWETQWKSRGRFCQRRLPRPCSRLCGTHQGSFKRPPESGTCRRCSVRSSSKASSNLSLPRGRDIRTDRLWKVPSLPALFSTAPGPSLPHGREKNRSCFLSLVPVVACPLYPGGLTHIIWYYF